MLYNTKKVKKRFGKRGEDMKRIAVITARADWGEQKEILSGITHRCFDLCADIAVYSNIFNHWVKNEILNFENVIYDFFEPSYFDGVIVTPEAFFDKALLRSILERIKKSHVPAVIIGENIEGFQCITTREDEDFEKIAEHLILVHGFTDIDILTGNKGEQAAENRVIGCKKAFKKYGIPFKKSKLHYGNFWTNSGEELARRYISGEIPMPQAVICANDHMAFGLCDRLTSSGIKIPQQITVTGYEYTENRMLHYPIITTYHRGRYRLGANAVNILFGEPVECDNSDRLIKGNTCGCGADDNQIKNEINAALIGQYHNEMSSVAQFGSALTACRSLREYMNVLKDYMYLHHGASDLYLCISKEWSKQQSDSGTYLCYNINSEIPAEFHKTQLPSFLLTSSEKAMVYCLCPLVVEKRCFGFTALGFDNHETYDFSFRDWSKTAANALEFLRMKNDIHYLRQCQSVSSLYDALTGFYNEREFREIAELRKEGQKIAVIRLFFTENEFLQGENYKNDIVSLIAAEIKKCCKKHEIRGRLSEDTLAVLYEGELFVDALEMFIARSVYSGNYENSVVVSFSRIDLTDLQNVKEITEHDIGIALKEYNRRRELTHYKILSDIRKQIMLFPKSAPSIDDVCRKLCLGEGRFRVIYNEFYGASYIQDCIYGRTALAGYLLCTSAMSVYSIAVECGYKDEKFFSRQFRKQTGYSPKQYRTYFMQFD